MTSLIAAMPTWARDVAEAELILSAVKALAGTGIPIIAADGGSPEPFLRELRQLSDVQVLPYRPDGPRLIGQVKTALGAAHASAAEWTLYTESDKRWFFEHRTPAMLEQAIGGGGMIIAARSPESFRTFPEGQQLPETLMNRLCAETWGQDGDYMYGPLLIHRALLPFVERLAEDVGWGWRPYLMAICHRLGVPLRLWEVDLPCPPEQRGENDLQHRVYRLRQLSQNVSGLALGIQAPLP